MTDLHSKIMGLTVEKNNMVEAMKNCAGNGGILYAMGFEDALHAAANLVTDEEIESIRAEARKMLKDRNAD